MRYMRIPFLGAAGLGAIALAAALLLPADAPAPSVASQPGPWIDALADLASEARFPDPAPDPLEFPADHGPHDAAGSESWQVAVHLGDGGGAFILAIQRLGLDGSAAAGGPWDVTAAYRAHAVYHPGGGGAVAEERFARAFPGLSGAVDGGAGVRIDHWVWRAGPDGGFVLEATIGAGHALSLTLVPAKTPLVVAPDTDAGPVKGYSHTRLEARGTLQTAEGRADISGTAWVDHYWGALPLPGAGPVATDRWLIHLDDGRDLSLLRSRRTDGRGAAEVAGVLVGEDGAARAFDDGAFGLEPERTWRDARDGTAWPVAWVLDGPGTRLELSALADDARHSFAVPLWSGPVRVTGRLDGAEVHGQGTMELTGYGG